LPRGIWHNGALQAELAPAHPHIRKRPPTGYNMSKPKLLIVEDDEGLCSQ